MSQAMSMGVVRQLRSREEHSLITSTEFRDHSHNVIPQPQAAHNNSQHYSRRNSGTPLAFLSRAKHSISSSCAKFQCVAALHGHNHRQRMALTLFGADLWASLELVHLREVGKGGTLSWAPSPAHILSSYNTISWASKVGLYRSFFLSSIIQWGADSKFSWLFNCLIFYRHVCSESVKYAMKV